MSTARGTAAVAALAVGALLTGCGADHDPGPPPDLPDTLTVTSPAIDAGGAVPRRFTCDGADVSPPLAWHGGPGRAAAYALVVDDPDAPDGTYVHWVLVDLPAGVHELGAGTVPAGAAQAENSAGDAGYTGPCPPSGTHRYRFTVYALSSATGLADGTGRDEALAAIASSAVATGRLVAHYRRG